MPLWIIASLVAAAAQAIRFMLQKTLSLRGITPAGATFARFAYSAPLVSAVLVLWFWQTGGSFPVLDWAFWPFIATGGIAQILATVCVVMLFQDRHFAVGVTLAKTEVIFTVVVGLILLGDRMSGAAILAILLGVAGLVVLSAKPDQRITLAALSGRSAVLGLTSGVLFAISAVTYRGASLGVEAEPMLRAGVTLAVVTSYQMAVLAAYLMWRQPGQVRAVAASWPRALPLGIASLTGSFCWFLAFTLQDAASVKAVGQIEIIFVLLIGALVFGERVTRREIGGMGLLAASILLLILLG